MAKIEKLKKEYEGEWLAIEVTKEENGVSIEGNLVMHTHDRERLWKEIPLYKNLAIYVTYAGPTLDDGYAAAF